LRDGDVEKVEDETEDSRKNLERKRKDGEQRPCERVHD